MNEQERKSWSDLDAFTYTGVRLGEPVVTISARNTMTLTSGFLQLAKSQLNAMTHVLFSFSKSENAIVIDFTNNSSKPGALKMTKRGNVSIAARSFFNWLQLDSDKVKGKYIAKLEHIPDRGKFWVVYLSEKISS